jgi:hypothetical protein
MQAFQQDKNQGLYKALSCWVSRPSLERRPASRPRFVQLEIEDLALGVALRGLLIQIFPFCSSGFPLLSDEGERRTVNTVRQGPDETVYKKKRSISEHAYNSEWIGRAKGVSKSRNQKEGQ